ncbi:9090_t:CDS:1, partial [Paraglomus occultum]
NSRNLSSVWWVIGYGLKTVDEAKKSSRRFFKPKALLKMTFGLEKLRREHKVSGIEVSANGNVDMQ